MNREITPKGFGIVEVFCHDREVAHTWYPNVRTGKGGRGVVSIVEPISRNGMTIFTSNPVYFDSLESWLGAAMRQSKRYEPATVHSLLNDVLNQGLSNTASIRFERGTWDRETRIARAFGIQHPVYNP